MAYQEMHWRRMCACTRKELGELLKWFVKHYLKCETKKVIQSVSVDRLPRFTCYLPP